MFLRMDVLTWWNIATRDGDELGSVTDVYFDDRSWTVRYLVVDAGSWLTGRTVLISPMGVDALELTSQRVIVSLTRDQVMNAPGLESAVPVSRAWERTYSSHYGYPYYWAGPHLWGAAPTPSAARGLAPRTSADGSAGTPDAEEAHLRSGREVSGYHLAAKDGPIGHVEDFLIDDDSWAIRALVVDTSNWIGGRVVLLSPELVERIEWSEGLVHVGTTREAVQAGPEYRRGDDPGEWVARGSGLLNDGV